jgi:methionyl-tRNA synthetase
MVAKNCAGSVPEVGPLSADDRELLQVCYPLIDAVRDCMDRQAFHEALEHIWAVVRAANGYVDRQAPWALRKTDQQRMQTVLYVLMESIRNLTLLVQPFVPEAAARLLDQLGIDTDARTFAFFGPHHALESGRRLPAPQPIFPRYVVAAEETG